MSDKDVKIDEDEMLAAEYVLRLLDGDEDREAELRYTSETEFAAKVNAWHEHFAPMASRLTPIMPPARSKQVIDRQINGHNDADVIPITRDPLMNREGTGRGGKIGLAIVTAIAAAFLAVLVAPQLFDGGPDAPAEYRTEIAAENGTLRVIAELEGRLLSVELAEGEIPTGRDLELWWIAPDNPDPISLGLLAAGERREWSVPEGFEPVEGVQLAVTDEPEGGSPTGAPTGDVLAIAPLTLS